jgi:hypothetical protein
MRELNVTGLMDKYKADHKDACEVLTGWELSGTLREFAPMTPRRIWFDYPIHVPDKQNFLAIATFNDSGSKGVGDEQKGKTDWFETVEELLELGSDTAVSLEAVGISESNAKNKFKPGTDYEVATLGDEKVVHRRTEDEIVYAGKKYRRIKKGKRCVWSEF